MLFAIANTILRQVATAVAPVIPMIWNLNTNLWNNETRTWN